MRQSFSDAEALAYIASYADLRQAFGADAEAGRRHFADLGQAQGRTISFQPLQYVASYPDLIQAIGTNELAAASHYIRFGAAQSRTTSFEGLSYIASHADLIQAYGANAEAGASHFIRFGAAEGRTTSFDALGYTASYPDLIQAIGTNTVAAASHYIRFGINQDRAVSFEALAYVASHADLIGAIGTNLEAAKSHFIRFGSAEGRTITFDPLTYVASYPDLIQVIGTNAQAAASHYIRFGQAEGRSGTFDALSYIASHDDLIQAYGAEADAGARHYIQFGAAAGRTTTFEGLRYIATHGDLIQAYGANAAAGASHYIRFGQAEGRTTSFDPVAYLLSQPDLQQQGVGADGALLHWVTTGFAQGRSGDATFGREQADHALAIGVAKAGNLDVPGDHDWFGLPVSAGQQVELMLTTQDATSMPTVRVFDAQGRPVPLVATQSTDGTASIRFTAQEAGVVYVTTEAAGGATGGYTLSANPFLFEITGTQGNDTVTGTAGDDILRGFAGDDVLEGRDGNDVLEGGSGYDRLNGGKGDDVLYGNNRDNAGADGADLLVDDQGGNDQLFGQDGDDQIFVSRYGDLPASTVLLDGGAGNNILQFAAGRIIDDVTVIGGRGDDRIDVNSALTATIDAGAGNDRVLLGLQGGTTTVTLGVGSDVLSFAGAPRFISTVPITNAVTVTDFASGKDKLFADTLLTSILVNWDPNTNPFASGHLRLVQSGADTLLRYDRDGGADQFTTLLTFADRTADSLSARDLGFSPDGSATPGFTQVGGDGADYLLGADGDDFIQGGAGMDTLEGRAGNDVLEGGAGFDRLNGGAGDDILYGNNAANVGLDAQDDLIDDQGGNDQLYGQDGNDFLIIYRGLGMAASTVLLDGGAGDDSVTFSAFTRRTDAVSVLGGTGNDRIRVENARAAAIDAGAGDDTVTIDLSDGGYAVTLGAGADVLEISTSFLPADQGTSTRVIDFEVGQDALNFGGYLGAVLRGWDKVTNPFEAGFLKLVQSGTDTLLQIDRDSAANGVSYSTLIAFDNTTASTFTAKELGYAPDGSAGGARGSSGDVMEVEELMSADDALISPDFWMAARADSSGLATGFHLADQVLL